MAEDKKVENIQDEIKLLKGEVKQSLASVRDYLLNMELPSTEFSTILAALGSESEQKITMKGTFAPPPENPPAEPGDALTETTSEGSGEDESEMPSEDDNLIDVEEPLGEESETLRDDDSMGQGGGVAPKDALYSPEDAIEDEAFGEPDELGEPGELDELGEPGELGELGEPGELGELGESDELGELGEPDEFGELGEPGELDEQDESMIPESEMSEEEGQPVGYDKTNTATAEEVNPAIPKVNMLANLINWIARAKNEIGYDQLTTFLEVYGISGHLSPELKEIIIHLSEISAERPEVVNNAEIWSQSMLSLHGILTGGDAPLHPVIPFWGEASSEAEESEEEEVIEVDKTKEAPVKLKLVFPNGDGKTKEFCVDLNPEKEEDDDDPPKKRKN